MKFNRAILADSSISKTSDLQCPRCSSFSFSAIFSEVTKIKLSQPLQCITLKKCVLNVRFF